MSEGVACSHLILANSPTTPTPSQTLILSSGLMVGPSTARPMASHTVSPPLFSVPLNNGSHSRWRTGPTKISFSGREGMLMTMTSAWAWATTAAVAAASAAALLAAALAAAPDKAFLFLCD